MDRRLLDALREIVGRDGIVAAADQRLVYECDMLVYYKGLPDLVVLPRSTAEVVAVVRHCLEAGVPVIPRGSGTGLIGGATAPKGGVMIGVNRMDRILEVDLRNRYAVVEPGVINLALTRAVQDRATLRSGSLEPDDLLDRRERRHQRRRASRPQVRERGAPRPRPRGGHGHGRDAHARRRGGGATWIRPRGGHGWAPRERLASSPR